MRIPILANSGADELTMMDLQGELKISDHVLENVIIGPLNIDGNRAELTIGNHLLVGKIVKLRKPLIVLKKGTIDGLNIIGYIRNKIVFDERPSLLFPDLD